MAISVSLTVAALLAQPNLLDTLCILLIVGPKHQREKESEREREMNAPTRERKLSPHAFTVLRTRCAAHNFLGNRENRSDHDLSFTPDTSYCFFFFSSSLLMARSAFFRTVFNCAQNSWMLNPEYRCPTLIDRCLLFEV